MEPTAPQLLAAALGRELFPGPFRCAYCGAACDDRHPAAVAKTFTDRPRMAVPDSPYRCAGCETAMEERAEIPGRDAPQKRRNYSWLIDGSRAIAATKANMDEMRSWCLSPPADGQYAICLSDSGQRHLLYLTPVNAGNTTCTITLEGERITYQPRHLNQALQLCMRIAAAAGKPTLTNWSSRAAIAVADYWSSTDLIMDLAELRRNNSLFRLAAWLTPKQEDCRNVYPDNRVRCERVPPPTSGSLFA